jgi:glycerol-3-phosphate acyltransferase PlsY
MELPWGYVMLAILLSYLCGSIPTSVWWGRTFHGIDVREHGSRNAGATNTFRVLGPKAGLPVLLIDMLKGFGPVRVLPHWSGLEPGTDGWIALRLVLALAAVVGHLYPLFAGFRGGKGIATSFGAVLAIHPGAAALCAGIFLLVFLTTRFVSLGSLCAALAFPLMVLLVFDETSRMLMIFAVVLSALIVFTHRHNIRRLLRGEENRMSLAGKGGNDG